MSDEERYDEDKCRWRMFSVSSSTILELLRPKGDMRCCVVQGLPEGAEIQAVNYDIHYDGWLLRVWHPSYDVVPLGTRIPDDTGLLLTWVRVDETPPA